MKSELFGWLVFVEDKISPLKVINKNLKKWGEVGQSGYFLLILALY